MQNLASSRRRKARCEVLCLIIVVGDIATFTGAHWSSLELTCHWSHTWVDWVTMTVRGAAPLQSPSLVIARNHFTAITINICPGSWPAAPTTVASKLRCPLCNVSCAEREIRRWLCLETDRRLARDKPPDRHCLSSTSLQHHRASGHWFS